MPSTAPLILFVVTEDWYFWSHRVGVARAAQAAGYRVALAARFGAHRGLIEAAGIECIELPFERSLRYPLRDVLAAWRLWKLIRERAPALVHLVALKPILLSLPAVLTAGRTRFVHAITGMGYLFATADGFGRVIQRAVRPLLGLILRRPNAHCIVQNADDLAVLASLGVAIDDHATLIPGSGVDLARYTPAPLPTQDAPIVLLPARMLRAKGVGELLAAAPLVRARCPTVRFVLAGGLDPDNPAAYTRQELEALVAEAGAEWWGAQDDMPRVYAAATLVCLPSTYREGVPKALIEAAACARPLVSTDTPGCRDICREGISGVLVPPREVAALATALIELLVDPARLQALGAGARQLAEAEFGAEAIHAQTLACYARLGVRPAPGAA